jgi:hypothetical protein
MQPRAISQSRLEFGLHSFGDGGQAQSVGQAHVGGDDGWVFDVVPDSPYEGTVDPKDVDRETPVRGERRIVGREVARKR